MRGATAPQPSTRRRSRSVVAIAAVAVTATLCAGAGAAIRGDAGPLPWYGTDMAAPIAPVDISTQAAQQGVLAERRAKARPSDDLIWPLHGAVTGRFGEARGGHIHAGIDIPMATGTPIRAAGSGTVVMREMQGGYGRYTCIAHRRITTCYAHQSRFRTKRGAKVTRGDVIGYVGNTGNSGTTHLHFEVRRGTKAWGKPANPAKLLPRG